LAVIEGRRKKEEGKEQVLIIRIYDGSFPTTSQSFLFPSLLFICASAVYAKKISFTNQIGLL